MRFSQWGKVQNLCSISTFLFLCPPSLLFSRCILYTFAIQLEKQIIPDAAVHHTYRLQMTLISVVNAVEDVQLQ